MKLGIYGDSFADDSYTPKAIADKSWPQLIKQNFNQVVNHAVVGSSLYYSMEHFERTHAQYDRIVFVITSAGRWSGVLSADGMPKPVCVSNFDQAMRIKDLIEAGKDYPQMPRDVQKQLAKTCQDVAAWFLGAAYNMPFELYVHRLMIERIKSLRPDAVVIPIISSGYPLVSISDFALRSLQWFDPNTPTEFWPIIQSKWQERHIACHLTPETNQVVYEEIVRALDLGRWDPRVPAEIVHLNSWDYYYSKR